MKLETVTLSELGKTSSWNVPLHMSSGFKDLRKDLDNAIDKVNFILQETSDYQLTRLSSRLIDKNMAPSTVNEAVRTAFKDKKIPVKRTKPEQLQTAIIVLTMLNILSTSREGALLERRRVALLKELKAIDAVLEQESVIDLSWTKDVDCYGYAIKYNINVDTLVKNCTQDSMFSLSKSISLFYEVDFHTYLPSYLSDAGYFKVFHSEEEYTALQQHIQRMHKVLKVCLDRINTDIIEGMYGDDLSDTQQQDIWEYIDEQLKSVKTNYPKR